MVIESKGPTNTILRRASRPALPAGCGMCTSAISNSYIILSGVGFYLFNSGIESTINLLFSVAAHCIENYQLFLNAWWQRYIIIFIFRNLAPHVYTPSPLVDLYVIRFELALDHAKRASFTKVTPRYNYTETVLLFLNMSNERVIFNRIKKLSMIIFLYFYCCFQKLFHPARPIVENVKIISTYDGIIKKSQ